MKITCARMPSPWLASGLAAGYLIASHAHAAPLSVYLAEDATPLTATYKASDSGPLEFAYFRPAGWKAGDKRPVVLLIHGGAWVAGDGKVFLPHARYFAARGAVALSIEYRLETETASSLENCLSDCKSAVRYLRAHADELGIDPHKIVAFGDSAGGHLAAALATCEGFDDPRDDRAVSAVPNAVVLCNPIVDLTEGGWIKYVIRGDALKKHPQPPEIHPTDEQLRLARALSPLFNVKAGQPPAILMHGTADTVVHPEQARQYAAACQKAGNRCDLVWMEGSRHAFVVPQYSAPEAVVVEAIRKADAFLASLGWLEGPPTLEVSDPPAWTPRK